MFEDVGRRAAEKYELLEVYQLGIFHSMAKVDEQGFEAVYVTPLLRVTEKYSSEKAGRGRPRDFNAFECRMTVSGGRCGACTSGPSNEYCQVRAKRLEAWKVGSLELPGIRLADRCDGQEAMAASSAT